MSKIQFSRIVREDLATIGLSESFFNPYNVKAYDEENNKNVAYIIVGERNANFQNCKNDKIKWLQVRKVYILPEYDINENLENLFSYFLISSCPKNVDLWANVYFDKKTHYFQRLGFFEPPEELMSQNENIVIYDAYMLNNE